LLTYDHDDGRPQPLRAPKAERWAEQAEVTKTTTTASLIPEVLSNLENIITSYNHLKSLPTSSSTSDRLRAAQSVLNGMESFTEGAAAVRQSFEAVSALKREVREYVEALQKKEDVVGAV
jgi:hypothetical protein